MLCVSVIFTSFYYDLWQNKTIRARCGGREYRFGHKTLIKLTEKCYNKNLRFKTKRVSEFVFWTGIKLYHLNMLYHKTYIIFSYNKIFQGMGITLFFLSFHPWANVCMHVHKCICACVCIFNVYIFIVHYQARCIFSTISMQFMN